MIKLHVFVHDKPVATLESADGFRHVMAYHPDAKPEQFVSLFMPAADGVLCLPRHASELSDEPP